MKDHICPSWFSFTLDNSIRTLFHDPEKILREYIKPGMTVIDIGCGPGFFTIPMATLAGASGKVIAVDIQKQMLARMTKRAARTSAQERIRAVQCTPGDITVRETADFILSFWMVHEVKEKDNFFRQILSTMKQESRYLLVEPKIHVTKNEYEKTIKIAAAAGLKPLNEVSIALSRSTLFHV